MSTRSSNGPESRARYFCTASGGQMHCLVGSPAWPQGQGFVAQMPWRLTAPTPKPHYPKQFKHLGDHIKARRIDFGLLQREVATRVGVSKEAIHNWERGHAEPEVRFCPALIEFLGYNPLPEPKTFGQAVRRERISRGWSIARLAKEAGVDPATISRLERDSAVMAGSQVAAIARVLGIRLKSTGLKRQAQPEITQLPDSR